MRRVYKPLGENHYQKPWGRLGFGIHKHHRSSSAVQKMCWPRVLSHETDTFDFNTHYH